MTFCVGTTPRAVASAVSALQSSDGRQAAIATLMDKSLQATAALHTADSNLSAAMAADCGLLFGEALRLLQEANRPLMRRLRTRQGAIDREAIIETKDELLWRDSAEVVASDGYAYCLAPALVDSREWEELVTPVPWSALQRAWQEIAKTLGRPYEEKYLRALLDVLLDALLLSARANADPRFSGECIWPASAAQLVCAQPPSPTVKAIDTVVRSLRPLERAARDLKNVGRAAKGLFSSIFR